MRCCRPQLVRSRQAGFSMVEMLITAFVMAVGLLGLAMLQTMSIKVSRGGQSLSSAILVAEQVMDRVELEGRLSWLNLTDTNRASPNLATDLTNLRYITATTLGAGGLKEWFDSKGAAVAEAEAFYTVTTTRVVADAAVTGRLSDVRVQVQFSDSVGANNAPILRELSLTRRIVHG